MILGLSEVRLFRDGLLLASELLDEANLAVSERGLEVVSMDPANIAMVVFRMLPDCFEAFDSQMKREVVGLKMHPLRQVLRRVEPGAPLVLESSKKNELVLKAGVGGSSERTFKVPLLASALKEQEVPGHLKFSAELVLDSKEFSRAVDDLDVVGVSSRFSCLGDGLFLECDGELMKADVGIKSVGLPIMGKDSEGGPVRSLYSIEYLKKFVGADKFSDKVTLKFADDYPLRLDYVVPGKMELSFILAPRIEN